VRTDLLTRCRDKTEGENPGEQLEIKGLPIFETLHVLSVSFGLCHSILVGSTMTVAASFQIYRCRAGLV
jgi:hypothetical protein